MSAPLNDKVALANAEYELLKAQARRNGRGLRITRAIMEKRHGLRPGQIFNYRTNHGLKLQ